MCSCNLVVYSNHYLDHAVISWATKGYMWRRGPKSVLSRSMH